MKKVDFLKAKEKPHALLLVNCDERLGEKMVCSYNEIVRADKNLGFNFDENYEQYDIGLLEDFSEMGGKKMKIILFEKSVYGLIKLYAQDPELGGALQILTGKKSLDDKDVFALKKLGHSVEIMQLPGRGEINEKK